ncbi:MAG: 1-acyl-sn-glycerol-3-phosphate acyltransferase [Treponema sp.]|jgi:1-acyl-sn-glycerol-3-phosphate acyltransferase|nr:1-acyl-sn-glycerol-3-phosphate acyltransferase [Treponema sp.]
MQTDRPYVPQLGISYPERPDEHMAGRAAGTEFVITEQYPFLDKSPGFRIMSALLYLGIFVLVFILSPVRFGLRIEGRKILKKNRKLLRDGALTVSNHTLRWDLLMILQAVRFRRLYFPAWKENLGGPDRTLIRLVGGIPVPTGVHAMKNFNLAFDELHRKKKWFHVFPEGSNWPYFHLIRPFKKGMFTMAYNYNLPVIPLAFSYRESRGLYKIFKRGLPLVTLRIGEPILPDLSKPRKEAVTLLRALTHRRIVELAGITDNPYPCEGD